ncbi:MAG: NAD-dependent epimerase/dehydratase family protein [Paludibacteraceae bacterium]|nr:NAD-dependent epimerase/dehydratase family protein [Paludibacteraceae bacterium]
MEKKTILLLGGFGFLGTNMLSYIATHNLPYEVIIFDKFDHHPHNIHFDFVKKVYAGDFADEKLLENIFKGEHIDYVVHSISTTVASNAQNPKYDILSNIIPTLTILDLMVKYNVLDILFISSGGAIYGDSILAHMENDDQFPKSSYGVHKLTIEKYLFLYASLYGIHPLVLRLSNPYGFYHYSNTQGVINVAMRKAVAGEVMQVYGTGEASKDYIWIDDFCDIAFQLIIQGVHTEILNVGSGEILSVNQILKEIKSLVPTFTWGYNPPLQLDVQHVSLNTDKLHTYIGTYSFTPFSEGLQRLCEWQLRQRHV